MYDVRIEYGKDRITVTSTKYEDEEELEFTPENKGYDYRYEVLRFEEYRDKKQAHVSKNVPRW